MSSTTNPASRPSFPLVAALFVLRSRRCGNALVAERWRDGSGNVIKETFQGIAGFVKRTFDAIAREIAAADYGTNGGAILFRPDVPPVTSETVLVTRSRYGGDGGPGETTTADGTVTRTKRDALSREIETIENFKEDASQAADVNRTTRFAYHASGGLETLTLVNDVTGDQVTRWVYGTTLTDSGVATGHLLRAKIYPESDDADAPLGNGPDGIYERTEHTYNRQGEVVTTKDPNETVHTYDRDKMGRPIHDRITAFGTGIADAVRRISTEYDPKRPALVKTNTSYDNASPGSGAILNQVAKAYNGYGQEIEDAQSHSGAVGGSTPKVLYAHANGANNTARRTGITYPNGRVVNLGYGASDSITDLFSLVKSVAISGESGNKVEYSRVGLGRFVEIAYPQPGVRMSMIRPGGGSEGDAGDPYDGFDRFSRTQAMRWEKTADGSVLDGWDWGYNEASNRTWKKNLVAAAGQDEAYGYDGLYQVKRDAVGTLNTNRTAIGGVPGEEEGFIYDPTGNWLGYRKDVNGSSVLDQSRSNNKDNQLTQINGSSDAITYDRAGNATKIRPGAGDDWSKSFALTWDAWNRIVEVKDENGTTVHKNGYDGLTRRITTEVGGEVVHTYWSDRWKPLEERIGAATTAARSFLWGERPGHRDELVLRDRDTDGNGTLDERLYATMDYFNGTAVLDIAGVVQERYAYSAFGVRRIMAADFSLRSSSSYAWEFGFQGQFRDEESGWYNYGYRFYVPMLGRWMNRDPITETGGSNLYEFSKNSCLNYHDLLGLHCRNCASERDDCYRTARTDKNTCFQSAEQRAIDHIRDQTRAAEDIYDKAEELAAKVRDAALTKLNKVSPSSATDWANFSSGVEAIHLTYSETTGNARRGKALFIESANRGVLAVLKGEKLVCRLIHFRDIDACKSNYRECVNGYGTESDGCPCANTSNMA